MSYRTTSLRRSEYERFYNEMRQRFALGKATRKDYKHAANLNSAMRRHWQIKMWYYLENNLKGN